MSNKENKDLLFSEISFWYLFYSRRCKTKSIMRVQRKARARDWLHFMSMSSCHLINDYKPLLTCRSRSNQNKDVIKMRGQISLSCETSRRFHLTWVFPANRGIECSNSISRGIGSVGNILSSISSVQSAAVWSLLPISPCL